MDVSIHSGVLTFSGQNKGIRFFLSPGMRRAEDGKIEWNWPVMRIYNWVRAVTEPYPGAFTHLPQGDKLLIWWAHLSCRFLPVIVALRINLD